MAEKALPWLASEKSPNDPWFIPPTGSSLVCISPPSCYLKHTDGLSTEVREWFDAISIAALA